MRPVDFATSLNSRSADARNTCTKFIAAQLMYGSCTASRNSTSLRGLVFCTCCFAGITCSMVFAGPGVYRTQQESLPALE